MRRPLLAVAALSLFMLLASATASDAQIIRPRYQLGQPSAWLSLGVGLQQGWSVTDGATSSVWQFSDATQYEGSLEKALSGGASIGLRGSWAKVPLLYRSATGGDVVNDVDSDANVGQLFATLHVSSGSSFHSVLELSGGATMYSNFRARNNGGPIGPTANDYDFSFAFGYGFGYAFSPKFSIDIVQDVTTTLHQKVGLTAGQESSVRTNGTRLVARFGMGGP